MIQGFFFDLDGTLVNTYEADFLAYRDAIQDILGIEIAEVDFNKTHGQEFRSKLDVLAPGTSDEEYKKMVAAKKQHYKKYVHLTVLNDELIGFLASFAEHHAMVIVTTAKTENALAVLEHHDIKKYFSHFVFGDEVAAPKPDPASYLLALERTGLETHQVIAFEDTDSGIKAAEAAGIAVIHIRTFAT